MAETIVLTVMAIAVSLESVLAWQGKVAWNRRIVSGHAPPEGFPGGAKWWFGLLRSAPAAAGVLWGAAVGTAILYRPPTCTSGACTSLTVTASLGLAIALVCGSLAFSVLYWNRPVVVVPPWMRMQNGLIGWSPPNGQATGVRHGRPLKTNDPDSTSRRRRVR